MAADACNAEVVAGPAEATVMGNIGVVLSALGEIDGLYGIRKAVSESAELKCYAPDNGTEWENAYKEYIKILN